MPPLQPRTLVARYYTGSGGSAQPRLLLSPANASMRPPPRLSTTVDSRRTFVRARPTCSRASRATLGRPQLVNDRPRDVPLSALGFLPAKVGSGLAGRGCDLLGEALRPTVVLGASLDRAGGCGPALGTNDVLIGAVPLAEPDPFLPPGGQLRLRALDLVEHALRELDNDAVVVLPSERSIWRQAALLHGIPCQNPAHVADSPTEYRVVGLENDVVMVLQAQRNGPQEPLH